ncbi:MAG: hypothetical protein ACOYJQ_06960 [Pseudochelatococcus sp.]|uniref:hypothetical protein n=1 Tax=Pseudochelatococcus sp. TaxID=2020869 RepID=UPI003D8B8F9A
MLETILIFAAGFLTAAVLALMILPGINARAARLARRRLEAQFPVSTDELTAQMDYIRAEGAVALRKAERLLEKEREARARHRTEAGAIEATLRRQTLADAATLETLRQDNETLRREEERLTAELDAVTEDRDARRIAIVDLETRLAILAANPVTQENALLRQRIATVADQIMALTKTEEAGPEAEAAAEKDALPA